MYRCLTEEEARKARDNGKLHIQILTLVNIPHADVEILSGDIVLNTDCDDTYFNDTNSFYTTHFTQLLHIELC